MPITGLALSTPLAVLLTLFPSWWMPEGPLDHAGVPNFKRINKAWSRGGQPTPAGVAELSKLGFVTIVDLRHQYESPWNFRREKAAAAAASIRFVSLPISSWLAPHTKDVDKILAVIDDPQARPVFVHCGRGSDRGAEIVALYRISHECWSADDAIHEALKDHMLWWQFNFRHFIKKWAKKHRGGTCD